MSTPAPETNEAPSQKGYYLAPSGMHDILPEQQGAWLKFRAICEKEATQFGYGRIETPVLEFLKVFEKGTGAGTDVVEKELYSLSTKGGEALALRPEFTPGIIRAYLEHGLASQPRPVRLFALGPLFRHDRPQKGRFRQFHQLDFECINSDSAACDVEIIFVTFRILKKLGLKNFSFHVSSIGDPACRPAYERQLKGHLRAHKSKLCGDCKRRLEKNPLRVFDCKEEKCQRVARVAPKIIDNLCEACHRHFKETLEMLDELEVPYQLNGNIVRGLDYYTRTVFEVLVTSDQAGEVKSLALGGGGRYDGLAEVLGGRPTPAVGVALGVERLIDILAEQGNPLKGPVTTPQVFIAQLGFLAKKKALRLMADLQTSGILVATAFDRDSLKSQLKAADRLKVPLALIIGQREVIEETVILRDMADGTQEMVSFKKALDLVKKRLAQLKKS